MQTNYITAPTQYIEVQGVRVAYRRFGHGVPIVYLNHLAANLDGCDPLIMDTLAEHFTVISFDYVGVGASSGTPRTDIAAVAQDSIALIRALGYDRVHLLGLSLGGFVAQEMLLQAPELIERVILAGTGPAGDRKIARVARVTYWDMLRGFLSGRDPRYYLFFPGTTVARYQGRAFLTRTRLRKDRDAPTRISALKAHLRAVRAWAMRAPHDLSLVTHRVWIVNGDYDRMVPTSGSYDLSDRLPNATLNIYEGAGHGAIFQQAEQFSRQALSFYQAHD